MATRREGQNLGPYRLIEQIGVGGMATVYKAYQPSMERYVAVKILPPHYADDPQFAQRFIREARTIAKLEHQNILPVHDFGEEEDTTYLVMRYLEGGTLKHVMKQGRIALPDIQKLFSQICSALDYAHRQGVIHRDVKPANIMIDKEGAVYLTDFGIAKVLKGVSQLTAAGAAIGTPTYMAPEQSLGKEVDARSDTYALGVILYEMVVGKVPYDADTPMAVAFAHVHEPLPLPREIDPAIPEPVEAVILKAMAKDPDDRFQSARELAAALSEAVSKPALTPPPPAEATLVDLVTQVWESQHEAVTRVEEAPVFKAPPAAQPPGLEPPPTVRTATPVGEAAPPIQELPAFGAVPKRRSSMWIIGAGAGGLAVVACITIALLSGIFSGGEDSPLAALSGPTATPSHTPVPTPTPIPDYPAVPTLSNPAEGQNSVFYLGFNPNKFPFTDPRVRQAIASVLDRGFLTDQAQGIWPDYAYEPAAGFTPPRVLGVDLAGYLGLPYDPASGRELLAQAGYPDGQGFPAIELTIYHENWVDLSEYIQAQLQDLLGINLSVTQEAFEDTYLPDFFVSGWRADYVDPRNFLFDIFCGYSNDALTAEQYAAFTSAIQNAPTWGQKRTQILAFEDSLCVGGAFNPLVNWRNDAYDALLDQALEASEASDRQKFYIQAEIILVQEDCVVIPLFYRE